MELSQHLKPAWPSGSWPTPTWWWGENRRQLADQLAAAWVCTGEAPPAAASPAPESRPRDPSRHCPGGSGGGGAEGRGRPGPSVGRLHPAQRGAKEGLPPGARGTAEPDGAEHPAQTHRGGPLLCLLPLSEPQPGAPSAHHPLPVRDPPGPGGGNPSGQSGGEQLANLILTGAPPKERLPFLISLEKRDREEIGWMLEETVARLTAALPQRPDLLPVLDRLAPIQRACDFNISAGHLCGWLAAAL